VLDEKLVEVDKSHKGLDLVPNILNSVSKAKVKHLTKLDVRWRYKNVRIWEGDEWNVAFQMS